MAAQNGTITLSHPGGLKETLSVYLSDVAGVSVKFSKDGKADANSPDNYLADRWTHVDDICLAAATGQTTTTVKVNDVAKAVLLNANFLAAITNRPDPGVMVSPGQRLQMYQVA